jgi:hypothetical protein
MAPPEQARTAPRILRTREEIFAAGYEDGANAAPLTDKQINLLAALFAPTLNASHEAKRGAA